MSNENNGLATKNDNEPTISWGLWILGWLLWVFRVIGMGAGHSIRHTSGIPGAAKRAANATWETAKEAGRETKKGYKAGRHHKPVKKDKPVNPGLKQPKYSEEPKKDTADLEDAVEVPLPKLDLTGRKEIVIKK